MYNKYGFLHIFLLLVATIVVFLLLIKLDQINTRLTSIEFTLANTEIMEIQYVTD